MKFDVDDKNRCRLVCVKISLKSVQVCGGCCKMFTGAHFFGTKCIPDDPVLLLIYFSPDKRRMFLAVAAKRLEVSG